MKSVFGWRVLAVFTSLLMILAFASCAKSTGGVTQVGSGTGPDETGMGTSGSQIIPARESGAWSGGQGSLEGYVERGDVKDIYFAFDKSLLSDESISVLSRNAEWFKKSGGALVLIEGHADERGTNEYNLALGERRAKAAKDFLVSLGIQSSRVNQLSYGEERPVCKEPGEVCWAKNRRDHFLVKMQ